MAAPRKISATGKVLPARAPVISITPRDIIQMVVERWIIGLVTMTLATAAFIYFQPKIIPVYRTEASLMFEAHKSHVLNVQGVFDNDFEGANELNTHMEQMRSKTFVESVIASFTPQEEKKIREAYRDPEHPNNALPSLASIVAQNFTVAARRGTTILSIGVTNRDPEMAALIANRFANRYIEFNVDRAATGTNSAMVFLRNQAEDMRNQVEAAQSELQAYREKHDNIAALGQSQNIVLTKFGSIGADIVKVQMEQVELGSTLDKIAEYRRGGKNLLEIAEIRGYGQVASLADKLDELKAERALLEQKYLRAHPKMLENEQEAKNTTQRLDESIQMAVANLQTRLNLSKEYEQKLHIEEADAQAKVHDLDRVSVDYNLLEQDAATKTASYAQIRARLTEAQIASQMDNANIKIFDSAYVPSTAGVASFIKLGGEAAALGLGSLLAITIGLGLIDTRIKTAAHIEQGLGETLLGAVKKIKGLGEFDRAHAFRLHKDGALEESYRGIYSEIDIRSKSPFPRTLVITSAMPGDGKSLTSSNLAAVFAAHGRRTVLVDCDLRRPGLHQVFGTDGVNGWTQWATSPIPVEERGPPPTVTIAENLELLPAGNQPDNPTEVLDRLVSSGLLKLLTETHDLVMLDTPPIAVFPDALLLCRHCQELIYVCRWGAVRVGLVRRTLERVAETGVILRGLVLNRMPGAKLNRYGYESYGSYKKDFYKAYAKR